MSYYRHIRTTQERRASQDGWGRPCRNLHNLPNFWDDIVRDSPQRSWKKHRRTQYKVKNIESDHIIGYGHGQDIDGV